MLRSEALRDEPVRQEDAPRRHRGYLRCNLISHSVVQLVAGLTSSSPEFCLSAARECVARILRVVSPSQLVKLLCHGMPDRTIREGGLLESLAKAIVVVVIVFVPILIIILRILKIRIGVVLIVPAFILILILIVLLLFLVVRIIILVVLAIVCMAVAVFVFRYSARHLSTRR